MTCASDPDAQVLRPSSLLSVASFCSTSFSQMEMCLPICLNHTHLCSQGKSRRGAVQAHVIPGSVPGGVSKINKHLSARSASQPDASTKMWTKLNLGINGIIPWLISCLLEQNGTQPRVKPLDAGCQTAWEQLEFIDAAAYHKAVPLQLRTLKNEMILL